MNQQEMFGKAKWLCGGEFPVLKGQFQVSAEQKKGRAVLRVLGLGFFHCYINGKEVSRDAFLPLSTDYEPRANFPTEETLTGHRIYVPEYDITSLVQEGDNTIAILFGGGWYTFEDAKYGEAKAIYRILLETENGTEEYVSSEKDVVTDSFIKDYYLPQRENHDYRGWDDAVLWGANCAGPQLETCHAADAGPQLSECPAAVPVLWKPARPAQPLDTEYLFTDCPADRVTEVLSVKKLGTVNGADIYDSGKNIAGWPVIHLNMDAGDKVIITFTEELGADGGLNPDYVYRQHMEIISDGKERIVRPMLTWFGFRYFSVEVKGETEIKDRKGAAERISLNQKVWPESVEVVHTNVAVTSSFESDNEILNWLYQAYLNTQLGNMHAGIPSDCPHIERRGYTGDGQLTCSAAMTMLDAKEFYRKWIYDIADCQDVLTGHVQYTAPYTWCGGGPGGWGCAIVEVPWQFYLHYGDAEPMRELYPQMLRYFDYLEAHSHNELVVSDKKGEWCLGDWCPPTEVILPAPFVNNYFYIKSLYRVIEIARLIGKEEDIPGFEEKIRLRKEAVMAAYYNTWDGNFIGNRQGANAFAVDMGIGDERTYQNLVNYYRRTGAYDTGIFGTDLVTRVLCEHGDGELAAELLMSEKAVSFAEMKRRGATTLWELWPDSLWDRSHNHPMFGAAVLYLFEYLLGIRQEEGHAGFDHFLIAPVLTEKLNRLSGSRTVPAGEIRVSYEKKDGTFTEFEIVIPKGVQARFVLGDKQESLNCGVNRFVV